jgi:hypothetical protein
MSVNYGRAVVIALVVCLLGLASCGTDKPAADPSSKWEQATPVVASATPSAPPKQEAVADGGIEKAEETDPDIPDGPAKEFGKQEIAILVDALPLRRDAVEFDAIDKFILLYAPFMKNKALLREARRAIRNARAQLSADMARVPVSSEPRRFVSLLKRPAPNTRQDSLGIAVAFADWTMDVLSLTEAIIGDFAAKVRSQLTEEQDARVSAQIGRGPGSSSIFGSNHYQFQELKRRMQAGE